MRTMRTMAQVVRKWEVAVAASMLLAISFPTVGGAAEGAARADRWQGDVSYVLGYKWLESGWAPADSQFEFGLVDIDFQKESWPVSVAVQLLMTYSDSVPRGMAGNNSGVWEFNLGARKLWRDSTYLSFRTFAGGGLSVLGSTTNTFQDGEKYNERSSAGVGVWADAGLYWNVLESCDVGFQVEYTWGEIRLAGRDLDAGGLHLLGMFGYHWGY